MTDIFNKNPPQSNFNFIWDVKKVINFLFSQKFEANDNLKCLTCTGKKCPYSELFSSNAEKCGTE